MPRPSLPAALPLACLLLAAPATAVAQTGSCDSVANHSICMDYSGSYWRGNTQAMKLNCSGATSTFRAEPCPLYSIGEKYLIGSCIYGQFQPFETMSHHFTVGGGGYDDPDFNFDWLRISCEGTGNVWVRGHASGR